MHEHPPDAAARLTRAALLRRFDRALLRAALELSADEAEAIVGGAAVEALGGGWFRLRPEVAARAAAQLRAGSPADEAAIHRRAFEHYLARLRGAGRGPADEDECMHHLDALYILEGAQGQWAQLVAHAGAARGARITQRRHLQRLAMVEGYSAIYQMEIERGEAILAELLGEEVIDPDVRVKALKGLADGASYRGRYGEAIARYERMHQAASAAGDQVYQGLALLNMGAVYQELDQSELALEQCERSLALFRAGGDRQREGYALYHAALYSLFVGRWDAARRYSTAAEEQFERLGLRGYLGFVHWVQGFLADIFDDVAAAEAAYLRALAAAEQPPHGHPTLAADTLLHLGLLAHSQGRLGAALAHYDRALAQAARLDREHQVCLLHFRRGQAFELLGRPGRAFLAYRAAIRGVERMGGSTTREDVKISLLGTTQQIYEAMVLLCLSFRERPGGAAWVARALHYVERARSRTFLDALARKAGDAQPLAAEAASPATLGEIQQRLPHDALLVEYFTTGVRPRGEHLVARVPPGNRRLRELLVLPARTVAFAIGHDRCEVFFPVLDPNRVRPLADDRHPGRHLLLGAMPVTLYEQLVAPVAALLAGRRLLYLVPHGPIHYVPFAALRTPGGASMLDLSTGGDGAGLALAQAPSATILVRSCLGAPPAGGTAALALGFNDAGGAQPLRFAEAEAEHIAGLLGGATLTGAQPKRERLRSAGRGLRHLHIAGHALFTPRDPLGSWLLLGDGEQLSAREIIGGIDLGVELVTLSSCTSGVSHVVPGDELLGLSRALLYAGAPTIVCTRWEAVDIVALVVMDRFYRELRRHSPAVALRNAQVAVRNMSYAELAQLLAGWVAEGGALAAAIGDPDLLLQEVVMVARSAEGGPAAGEPPAQGIGTAPDPEQRPFAAPLLWAPFMVIGRA